MALVDENPVGTAGTLISAALETSGHYVQSHMLDVFDAGLATSLGGLLMLISAVAAIFIVAVGGNYKFGVWFLVGPILFYAVTLTRTPSTGAIWQFGSRVNGGEFVDEAISNVVDTDKEANVSWFFARWNQLVSLAVRSMTEVVRPTENDGDLNFINQTTRYLSFFHAEVEDPKMQEFVRLLTFSQECLPYYNLQFRRGALDNNAVGNQEELDKRIKALSRKKVTNTVNKSFNIIRELKAKGYFEGVNEGVEDGEVINLDADSFTCKELWRMSIPVIERAAITFLAESISTRLANGQDATILIKELEKKFTSEDRQNKRYMYLLHAITGKMLLNTLIDMEPGFQKYHTKNRISSYAYDNTYRPGEAGKAGIDNYNDPLGVNENLRWWSSSTKGNRKGEYLNFMQGLPYLQGVVLYFLSVTFPFFAVALIIPGRHHTLLLWMGLWAWVKSWDFGLAIVMRLERILFQLLPTGPQLEDTELGDPSQVFKVLASGDPTYSVYIYYHIMATLMAAIPIVSGILVKKASGEVVSAVSQGYKDFAGHMGESLQSYTAGSMTFERMNEAERFIENAGKESFKDTLKDERFLKAIGMWKASSFMNKGIIDGVDNKDKRVLNQIASAMNSATAERNKNVIDQLFKTNATIAMNEAARSEYVGDLMRKSVMTGWASHSKIDKFDPVPDIIDLALTEDNYNYAGVFEKGYAGLRGKASKQIVNRTAKKMANSVASNPARLKMVQEMVKRLGSK